MKTNLYLDQLGIISSLGFGIKKTQINLKLKPNIQPFSLDNLVSLPISQTNQQASADKAFVLADLVMKDIWEKLPATFFNRYKAVLLTGCTKGELQFIANNVIEKKITDFLNSDISANAINKKLSLKYRVPFIPVSSAACATGAQTLQKAQLIFNKKNIDKIFLCMTEASLTKEMISAFYQLGVLTNQPNGTAPFHSDHYGFHMGEGATAFLISPSKNSNSFGKILGVATATDAFHFTSFPDGPKKVWKTINDLCHQCNISIKDIDHVNLHATGTAANDEMELALAKLIINENNDVSFSAFKPFTGHLLGASGLIEFALCLLCAQNNWFPPILNCNNASNLPSQFILEPKGRKKEIKKFISLSYGLGSTIGVILGEKL